MRIVAPIPSYHLVEQPHPRRFNGWTDAALQFNGWSSAAIDQWEALKKIKEVHTYIHTDMVTYRPTRPRGAELVKICCPKMPNFLYSFERRGGGWGGGSRGCQSNCITGVSCFSHSTDQTESKTTWVHPGSLHPALRRDWTYQRIIRILPSVGQKSLNWDFLST